MRICSLLPSGTEILFALGMGDDVIGITDLCDYPPEVKTKRVVRRSLVDPAHLSSAQVEIEMQQILRAGKSPFFLNKDWLRREKPDLILTQDLCYFCDVDANEVMDAVNLLEPSPQILVLSPKTLSDIFENVKRVGEAAGAIATAEELTKQLHDRVGDVANKADTVSYKPRVLSLEGINPLLTGGHWLPEMKMLAGGRDELFSSGCPAQRISWETVLKYDPEVLINAPCSSDVSRGLNETSWLVGQEGWWNLTAVKTGDVYIIDHVYYSTPGPRIVIGLEILAQILHPELFPGMLPPGTVVKLDTVAARDSSPEKIASYFNPHP